MRLNSSQIPRNYTDPYWTDPVWQDTVTYILQSLGYPVVRIELTQEQILMCIHDAIAKFMKWGDANIDTNLEVLSLDSDGYATLPDTIHAALVKDIIFVSRSLNFSWGTELLGELATPGFVMGSKDFFNLSDLSFDLTRYVQWRKQLEDTNDILGLKRTWEIFGNKIKFYPTKSSDVDGAVGVLYGRFFLPVEFAEDEWVRDYAVAKAMHLLSMVRRKFSGFTAPAGAGSTDGEGLGGESIAKMTELIESLKSERPSPPMAQF